MRYFFSTLTDASFQDPAFMRPFFSLQMLSISIINEAGESITLLNDHFNPSQVSEKSLNGFLREGAYLGQGWAEESKIEKANVIQSIAGLSRHKMKKAIREFIGVGGYLYGYEPFEDFAVLNSLGIGLTGFYRYDLKQMADMISAQINDDFGLHKKEVNEDSDYPVPEWEQDESLAPPTTAMLSNWYRALYLFLENFKAKNNLK